MFHYPLGGKAHVYISGHDLSEFRAKLESGYAISGCSLENHTNQAPGRSGILLLCQNVGPLTIRLPLDFYAGSKRDTMAYMARFNALCQGIVEIDLSDGFTYRCTLTEIGETAWLGDSFCAVDYTFSGVRQGEPATLEGPAPLTFQNAATYPKSDCIITVKNFKARSAAPVVLSLTDGARTLLTWRIDTSGGLYQAGGDLVLDGVNKQNRYRGGNIPTGTMTFTDYPYLVLGQNTVAIRGGVTSAQIMVDYTPAFL